MSTNAQLTADVAALQSTIATMQAETNTLYLLWAGSIREKNVKNILLKNLLDACMGALTWYFIGYGVAYDGDAGANGFIGRGISNFALSGLNDMGPEHLNGND